MQDLFGEYVDLKNLSIALNRRTGYVMVGSESLLSMLVEICWGLTSERVNEDQDQH